MEKNKRYDQKIYNATECCVFRKTKEVFGGLSNMASGFPLRINGISILSTEALYQACRFPHLPDLQVKIIHEKSPMTAKMVCKPYRNNSRNDWDEIRIKIMRWCLRVKLAQNFIEFGKVLESTFDKPIVEDSLKDDFWGAIRDSQDNNILRGTNALGRLLMELRQFYNENRYSYEMFVVEPLNIQDFKLCGQFVETIDNREIFISSISRHIKLYNVQDLKSVVSESLDFENSNLKQSLVKKNNLCTIETKDIVSEEKKKKSKKILKEKKTKDKFEGQATLPF